MRYPSTLPGLQAKTRIYGRHVFLIILLIFFVDFVDFFGWFFWFFFGWFLIFFCHHHTTGAVSQVHRRKNSCIFTSSCSWRRWFNNNNNSKQCCFKNQRWQNNQFSSESKQKSGHLVSVSEWWAWQCLSWETFLPTVPCQRPLLSMARLSVDLDSARDFFFFFFAAVYSSMRNRTRVVVNRAVTRAFNYLSQPYT